VGEKVDLDVFTRSASHLRRIFETLGIERQARAIVAPTVAGYVGALVEGKAGPP
jgi:hypothetical protein